MSYIEELKIMKGEIEGIRSRDGRKQQGIKETDNKELLRRRSSLKNTSDLAVRTVVFSVVDSLLLNIIQSLREVIGASIPPAKYNNCTENPDFSLVSF
jgi:hypothetical protein